MYTQSKGHTLNNCVGIEFGSTGGGILRSHQRIDRKDLNEYGKRRRFLPKKNVTLKNKT